MDDPGANVAQAGHAVAKDYKARIERARAAFGGFPGVVAVTFGQKCVGGVFSADIAIAVFVTAKKPATDLKESEKIPPTFDGFQTDVVAIAEGKSQSCDNGTKYDDIQGGIQIENRLDKNGAVGHGQGTLGCVVKRRGDRSRENVYLLTNKHVLYSPKFGDGEHVHHPTMRDDSIGIVVKGLYANIPLPPDDPNPKQFFVDCALARIQLDCTCFGSTCTQNKVTYKEALVVDLQVGGADTIADVRSITDDPTIVGKRVFKVGRTTGRTVGFVRYVDAALMVNPDPEHTGEPKFKAGHVILIEFDPSNGLNCKGNAKFSEEGDSGAVVLDEQRRVVGLHFTAFKDEKTGIEYSGSCHIVPVLDQLGICIPTTGGTSHGSSHATDGSGVDPRPVGDFELTPGQIAFTSASVEGTLLTLPGAPAPIRFTEEQERHAKALLANFRSTRAGADLHQVFATVRREVGYLVRNVRPVKVAWHRHKGPAFLAHLLNHLAGQSDRVPHELQGITRHALLVRMREVLGAHGSRPLRHALQTYGDDLLAMWTHEHCDSVGDCIAWLQKNELT